jgi:diguanylate cyclase (GGDEF)-like protein
MDLDRFKEVNDTLGHHAGDLLLERVAERLQGVVRDGDAVARLGGDEFAVLLPRVTDAEHALATAARIRAELERPFQVEGLEVDSPPSIGVALFPDHGVDLETLLRHGDVAMYAAKARQGGIEIYRPEHDRLSPDRLSLVAELRRAIDEAELVVYYQPKADLLTGEVSAVEALVRWAHPERGLVPPDEFIAIAEQTGLIRPLAAFVLEESLRQCAAWAAEGLELDVSVNLSARNLDDAELPDQVAALLERTGVPAHRLQLEITETTLMGDPARAKQVLGRLDAMGIGLSLDDFGIGSSSLAYLRELPFAELKIDRSFVQRMAAEENYALIVRTTIAMSQGLGLRVVAEGVETEEVWGLLADLGCDQAQGYVLTRPIPAVELRAWIQARSDRAAA